jgi:rfaE bifunctional protein kinase chain/domain
MTLALRRAQAIVRRFARVRLVVAGDLVADEFIYGRIDRVSREAPVLIVGYNSSEIVPGGAGNAANNAATLGARVRVVGVVGRDPAGTRLLEALPARADTTAVRREAAYATPTKTRILAGGVHSAKQQVVRIDRAAGTVTPRMRRGAEQALARLIRRADAVVISDYGAGLITPDGWRRAVAASGVRQPPLVFVDSRYALASYTGVTACTPNESEVEALAGVQIDEQPSVLEGAGRRLLTALDCRAVLVTRGSRGMALFEPRKPTEHIPIVGSDQVTDVTGAGDTVMAVFSLAVAAGATFSEAAHLANHAGGLVVMKRGTATLTAGELVASLGGGTPARRRRA